MSDKLISADYLFAKIDKWVLDCDGISFEELKKTLNNAPAVDAVEVVRCNKCVHWDPITRTKTNGRCRVLMELRQSERYMMEEDYFCKSGERREENAVDRCGCDACRLAGKWPK